MKPQSPCLNCKDRTPTCHSSCELYLDFKTNLDTFNQHRAKQKAFEDDYCLYKKEVLKKFR